MIMLVAVVALMAAMLAVNAMPAFAKGPPPNVNKAYYHACNPLEPHRLGVSNTKKA
jgi:hypothetical protein